MTDTALPRAGENMFKSFNGVDHLHPIFSGNTVTHCDPIHLSLCYICIHTVLVGGMM